MAIAYIDALKEDWTEQELTALLLGQIKPYPESWYKTDRRIIADRNLSAQSDWTDLMEAIANGDADIEDIDWAEFTCPVEKWAYMYCNI